MSSANPSVSPILDSFQFNWDPLGIENPDTQETQLSIIGGNPVRGVPVLKMTGTGDANTEIIVFDCSGRELWSSCTIMQNGSEEYAQVSPLPAGTYRILLRENNSTQMVLPMVVLN